LTNIKAQNGIHLINIYRRREIRVIRVVRVIWEIRENWELFGCRFGEFKKKQYLCAAQKNIINK
jgi:hypothetical protein